MNHSLHLALSVVFASAVAGCSDDVPSVEIVSTTPTVLQAGSDAHDDLTIGVRYEDPNGDLGGGVAEVHDCRGEGLVTAWKLPNIASAEAVDEGAAMAGELSLVVRDVDLLEGRSPAAVCSDLGADPGAFCVVLVDAAGNSSPGACTEPIAIQPADP